jgi:hypothetical protein
MGDHKNRRDSSTFHTGELRRLAWIVAAAAFCFSAARTR